MNIIRVAFVHPVNIPGAPAKTSVSTRDDHLTLEIRSAPDGVSIVSALAKDADGDTFVPMSNISGIGYARPAKPKAVSK